MQNQPQRIHKRLVHVQPLMPQPIVFITCATYKRLPLLANQHVHETLNNIWEQSLSRNGWAVGDYILMPDHIHLFVRQAMQALPMAKWIGMWKSMSARRIKAMSALLSPVWQPDYFDRFLRSGDDYTEKWSYVEANPVRAGLVEKAEDWPYRGQIVPLWQ